MCNPHKMKTRACLTCGKPRPKIHPGGASVQNYDSPGYCSVSCSSRRRGRSYYKKSDGPDRECEGCGSVIPRYWGDGHKRTPAYYNGMKYCNKGCKKSHSRTRGKPCKTGGCEKTVSFYFSTGALKSTTQFRETEYCKGCVKKRKINNRAKPIKITLSPMDLFLSGRTLTGEIK